MAIIVEETRKRTNFLSVMIWLIVIGVIGFAAYYIFFKQPEIVDLAIPNEFQDTTELSKIKLNRASIDNDATFGTLKPYTTPPSDSRTGRSNPFLSF